MPGKFKSRDVQWLPGGNTRTLTNEGKSPARFVTVEVQGACVETGVPPVHAERSSAVSGAAATSVSLRAFDQRIPRRNQADPMQLGGEAVFIGGG
jgi:hypothetical protein